MTMTVWMSVRWAAPLPGALCTASGGFVSSSDPSAVNTPLSPFTSCRPPFGRIILMHKRCVCVKYKLAVVRVKYELALGFEVALCEYPVLPLLRRLQHLCRMLLCLTVLVSLKGNATNLTRRDLAAQQCCSVEGFILIMYVANAFKQLTPSHPSSAPFTLSLTPNPEPRTLPNSPASPHSCTPRRLPAVHMAKPCAAKCQAFCQALSSVTTTQDQHRMSVHVRDPELCWSFITICVP